MNSFRLSTAKINNISNNKKDLVISIYEKKEIYLKNKNNKKI